MSYLALQCCSGFKVPVEQTNKPSMQKCGEKWAFTTDLVVAGLITTIGILAIIQISGLANLGHLSGIGSIGTKAAYAMIATGGAVVATNIFLLMIKQACFITKLQNLLTSRNSLNAALQGHIEGESARKAEAIENASRPLRSRIDALESDIDALESHREALGKTNEALEERSQGAQKRIEVLTEALKEFSDKSGRQEALIRELEERARNAEEKTELIIADSEKNIKQLREECRKAAQHTDEHGEEKAELIEELSRKLKDAERNAEESTQEKQRLLKELGALREEILHLKQTIQKEKTPTTEVASAPSSPPVPSQSPDAILLTEVDRAPSPMAPPPPPPSPVIPPSFIGEGESEGGTRQGGALSASLLMRKTLNPGNNNAPQMPTDARAYVLKLVGETKLGLSRIRGAIQGFEDYLNLKVEGLKLPPSSHQDIAKFGKMLDINLEESLFGSQSLSFNEEDLTHSFLGPVAERIDLEQLDPTLKKYFITLADWIKEDQDTEEQIKRTCLAMEKLATELIDVKELSEKNLEEARSRRAEESEKVSEELGQMQDMREALQKEKIDSILTVSPTLAECYDLLTLNFNVIKGYEVDRAIANKEIDPLGPITKCKNAEAIKSAHDKLKELAEALRSRNLREEDVSEGIAQLQKQAETLKVYIDEINLKTKVKHKDMMQERKTA